MKTILFSLLLGVFSSLTVSEEINWDAIINTVNNNNEGTWKAGLNFPRSTPQSYLKKLQGTILHQNKAETTRPSFLEELSDNDIPAQFDSRTHWPNCKNTINHIRDQGDCGSCWAVASASAFTDELCIANKLDNKKQIASEDVLACTIIGGCYGGFLDLAWLHIKYTGSVTGGDYNSYQGCSPYTLQPCEHHTNGSRPQCQTLSAHTPSCTGKCSNTQYPVSFQQDKHHAKDYFRVAGEQAIQKAILTNGPVVSGFDVYEDFVAYKSGVYHHVTGKLLGGHAVRIIGWGTENNTPYWLVANSWNTDWGDKGFFKILRGSNECEFESQVYGGSI